MNINKGGYNVAPEGWEQITQSEFAGSAFFVYSVPEPERRQLHRTVAGQTFGRMIPVMLFWLDDYGGYAVESYHLPDAKYGDPEEFGLRFYRFGCVHKVCTELAPETCRTRGIPHYGMHWHVHECSYCGKLIPQDSSD